MNYTYEITDSVNCKFELSLTQKDVSKYMNAAYKQLKKNAPKDFSFECKEKHNDFYQQIVNGCIQKAVADSMQQAAKNESIFPVSCPLVNSERLPEYGMACELTLQFEILPQIRFPMFSEIQLSVQEPDIPQHEIFMEIEKIMRPVTTLENVAEKRLPKLGDIVVCSVEASVEGKPFLELCLPELALEIDYTVTKNALLREVENICRILYAGEKKSGTFVLGRQYPNPQLRDKTVSLSVTLHKIIKRNIPTLTEATAQKLNCTDVKTLKTKAYAAVMNNNVLRRRNEANAKLMDMLLEKQDFVVPQAVYRFFLTEHLKEITDYLKKYQYTKDELNEILACAKEEDRLLILENAKRHTYLLAYAYQNGIDADKKDVDKQLELIAKVNNKTVKAVREEMEGTELLDTLKEQIMASKAFDRIYSSVTKIMVDSKGNPVKNNR